MRHMSCDLMTFDCFWDGEGNRSQIHWWIDVLSCRSIEVDIVSALLVVARTYSLGYICFCS